MTARSALVIVPVALYIVLTAIQVAVSMDLAHDEQQFVASALMVANHGIHPYRDFPYFHAPNLVYIYAALFEVTDHPFFAARILAALCGAGVSLLVLLAARADSRQDISDESGSAPLVLISAAFAILITNSPLWALGTGLAWNHPSSTLFALLAVVLFGRGVRRGMAWRHLFLSGFCLGFAMSIRLTFAPLVVPFLAAFLLPPVKFSDRRLNGLYWFAAGGVVSSLPVLYFLATHTDRFLFGTIWYEGLTDIYRSQRGSVRAMTLPTKLIYAAEVMAEPRNLPIVAAIAIGACSISGKRLRAALQTRTDLMLLALVTPFVVIGALAPTPSFEQYFFGPLAFAIMLVTLLLTAAGRPGLRGLWILPLLLIVAVSFAFREVSLTPRTLALLSTPRTWVPSTLHEDARLIADRLQGQSGRILTIGPLYALEAGFPVYPPFVTGRFGWRVAYLMTPEERARQGMVSPAELDALIESDHPIAVLTGVADDEELEEPLAQAAAKLGFKPHTLQGKVTLWLPDGLVR